MSDSKIILITCFICGKDLRHNVIKVHIDQCLPSNQELPSDYKDFFAKIDDGIEIPQDEINEFNDKANKLFKEVSLVPCPNCGRKFYHDRIEVHIKSCKGDNKKKHSSITGNKQLNINNDSQRLFLQKLEKELQNEEKDSAYQNPNPRASYAKTNSLAMSHASTERNSNKLRGSVNVNKKKQPAVGDDSNKIFLEKLEKELQTQDNQEGNLPSASAMKKKKEESNENSNKLFLEKLNKELKNEHEPEITEIEHLKINKKATVNKPLKLANTRTPNLHENKKVKQVQKDKNEIDSKQKFMELLDKELSKESELYKSPEPKTTKDIKDDSNKLFLEKLEKEIQKDSSSIPAIESSQGEDKKEEKEKTEKVSQPSKLTTATTGNCNSSSHNHQDKKNISAQYLGQHQPSVKKSQLKVSNILCFICGKDYGSSSLPIHLNRCEGNWKKEHPNIDLNAEKPKILEDLLTQLKEQKLTQSTVDTYIKQSEKAFRILNYFPCPNCGQKFLMERLNVHLKGCHAQVVSSTKLFEEKVAKQLESQPIESQQIKSLSKEDTTNSTNSNPNDMPRSTVLLLSCYICGKEFDKKALGSHLDECIMQHANIQTILPRELEKIFAKMENEEGDSITVEEINIYNNIAKEQLKLQKTMKNCPLCKKNISSDRFEIHLNSCKPSSMKEIEDVEAKEENNKEDIVQQETVTKVESESIKEEANDDKEENDLHMMACYKCGKEFHQKIIEAHMRTCEGLNN